MQRFVLVFISVALLPLASASAQSLGDAAAKEQERRKQQTRKPTKVITEDQLRSSGPGSGTFSSGAGSAAEAPAPVAEGDKPPEGDKDAAQEGAAPKGGEKDAARDADKPKEKSPEEVRAEQQAAWRQKVDDARNRGQELQKAIDATQARLGDPGCRQTGACAGLLTQLEDLRKQQVTVQQQIDALQDEGRRNGYR